MKTSWTDAEIALLKEKYPTSSIRTLQTLFNRSVAQINGKAYTLGLVKTDEYLKNERYQRNNITNQLADKKSKRTDISMIKNNVFKKTVTKISGDGLTIQLSQGTIKNAIGKIGESIVQKSNLEINKILLAEAISEFGLEGKKYLKFNGGLYGLLVNPPELFDQINPKGDLIFKKMNEIKSFLRPNEEINSKIDLDRKSLENYFFLSEKELKKIQTEVEKCVSTYPDDIHIFLLPDNDAQMVKFKVKYYRYRKHGNGLTVSIPGDYVDYKNLKVNVPVINDYRIALIEVKTTVGTKKISLTPNQIDTKNQIKSNPRIKYYLVKLTIPPTQIKFPKTLRAKILRLE